MPKNDRPVGPIPGTSLIKALDAFAVVRLRDLASRQADDGPEGLMARVPDVIDGWEPDVGGSQHHIDNTDDIRTMFTERYARGVTDVLAWLSGDEPSVELIELLDVKIG